MEKLAAFGMVLCVAVVGVPSTAVGQTMEFGADSTDDQKKKRDEASKKAKKLLEEGKRLFDEKKYDQASLIFFQVLNKDSLKAGRAAPEARYELAKTLLRMNLYQGALTHYGKIAKSGGSHPYYAPSLRGLLALAEVIPADPTLREHLAGYAEWFPDQVPEKSRARYAYLTGRYFYEQLNVEQAVRMFDAIPEGSKFYAKGNYIEGITYVADYQAEPASKAFKDVLRHLGDKRGTADWGSDQQKLWELTTMAMARVFYSTGDYETSLKYYDQIGRDSPRWPQALFESAWAYFQIDKYNNALGNLHSLTSPFFAESYFPEGPILSSVIYFYNCRYDRVRHELDDFEYTYEPLQEQMQTVLDDVGSATEMFDWYKQLQKGKVEFDDRVARVIRAALDDKEVQKNFELVELIREEIAKIDGMPKSWKTSSLGESLKQEATLAESFAIERAGSLARERLKRRIGKLKDLVNQKKRILFEVARAERGRIEADVRAGMQVEAQEGEGRRVNAGPQEMYWKFNGEYWRDEVGDYVFNVTSKCQR